MRSKEKKKKSLGVPHTEQSVVSRPGQEVEAVAVRRSGRGEAQGRYRGRVTCELL